MLGLPPWQSTFIDCLDIGKLTGQEVTLIPVMLDRSERMLCQPLTQLHLFLISLNSSFHFVVQILIHPTGDAAIVFAAGTLGLDWTLRTRAGGVVLNIPALLSGLKAEGEHLSRWAPVAILLWIIVEVFFAEETVLAAGGGSGLGHER
jgi:hypothetical protein